MPSREGLMVCIESSFGTAKATPVLGTDKFYVRLSENNAFEAEMSPVELDIPYGGGRTTRAETVADQYECKGKIRTLLYPGIVSEILGNWAITQVNSGRTTPWTTTDAGGVMPVGDLASLSFYHFWQRSDSTYKRQRYSGAKCDDWSISFTEDRDGRKGVLEASFTAIKVIGNAPESSADPDATEFPDPAETDYPTGPYMFSHLGSGTGTVKIGSARTQLASLKLSGKNSMDPRFFEGKFILVNRFCGRMAQAECDLRLKPTPDDLAAFQSLTAQDSEFKLDNGVKTFKVDFNGKNFIRTHARDLPMGKEYMRKLTVTNNWDPAVVGDISLATT